MSIVFGICQAEGHSVEEPQLAELAMGTGRYALDGTFMKAKGRIGMGFQPYHTHLRSTLDSQPTADGRGNMLTLDGRIDNHAELCKLLDIDGDGRTDSQIVLAAFERWGEGCFSRLVGDWALVLWSHADRSLYLGRDHAGSRTLYFEQEGGCVLWSTFLETFFVTKKARELDQRFAAGYLACQPIRDLTPFKSIRAVPPAHFQRIRDGSIVCRPHWQWMIEDRIQYRSDPEYEENFLALFRQSVMRRTEPGAAILAQLSGGMDSASIVCMSDRIRRHDPDRSANELLDTMSLYNDLEPNWDEKPYFTIVEKQRGKTGIHVDTSSSALTFEPSSPGQNLFLLPGCDSHSATRELEIEKQLGGNYRAILSGVGGDEVLGGVPSPMPELADLIVGCKFTLLLTRSIEWCLVDRTPLLHMLSRALRFTLQIYGLQHVEIETIPDWIAPEIRAICLKADCQRIELERNIGLLPTSIDNGRAWWSVLESMPHLFPSLLIRREYRYPYLDRDLVEFLFRVPREKLASPGRRRTLMRSALKDIVPAEILERRRKAYVIRKPLTSLQNANKKIQELFVRSRLAEYGFIAPAALCAALNSITDGQGTQCWPFLMRSISLELWLRSQPPVLASQASQSMLDAAKFTRSGQM
jgi:asparagine synthase (glutamine-hydrolysing)